MRTSHSQYITMVEFMEANGDLSKHSGGVQDRISRHNKWQELVNKLNSDCSGIPRSDEKWRKVWSDYKNNSKRKWNRITRAASDTSRGSLNLCMTDLENRVMQIMGVQAATGMVVEEAGFQEDTVSEHSPDQSEEIVIEEMTEIDWKTESTSQPTMPHPPLIETNPLSPVTVELEKEWKHPPKKKMKRDLTKVFIDADRKAREYARERDRVYEELEKERLELKKEELRVRELEVEERVRQRDEELRLQAQWLAFMQEALQVIVKYVDKKS